MINASLYGAVREAGRHPQIGCVYGALGGSGAVIAEKFLDLKTVPGEELELLLSTPSSAIGTSRDHLEPEDYRAIARVDGLDAVLSGIRAAEDAGLENLKINCVLLGGVNDDEIQDFVRLTLNKPWQVRFMHTNRNQRCLPSVMHLHFQPLLP